MPVTVASPTQLTTISMCEGNFVARYVKDGPRLPFDMNPRMGNVIDRTCKEWVVSRINEETEPDPLGCINREMGKQIEIAEKEGGTWSLQAGFDREALVDRLLRAFTKYRDQQEDTSWLHTDVKLEGQVGGRDMVGFVDAIKLNEHGVPTIVDWKAKTRAATRHPVTKLPTPEFREVLQLSVYSNLYALEMGEDLFPVEIHGIVWKTMSMNHFVAKTPVMGEKALNYWLKRWDHLRSGGDPVLNPESFLCSAAKCEGWDNCIMGGEINT